MKAKTAAYARDMKLNSRIRPKKNATRAQWTAAVRAGFRPTYADCLAAVRRWMKAGEMTRTTHEPDYNR